MQTARDCAALCSGWYAFPGERRQPQALRVVRGGGWNNKPEHLRSANRNRNTTDEANNNLGFRLARPPATLVGVRDFKES
ncbi:MAG: SUMF1/EgtB/PvdO family nonheme iron enzyme [Candidatus Thiodiazotropha sp.]